MQVALLSRADRQLPFPKVTACNSWYYCILAVDSKGPCAHWANGCCRMKLRRTAAGKVSSRGPEWLGLGLRWPYARTQPLPLFLLASAQAKLLLSSYSAGKPIFCQNTAKAPQLHRLCPVYRLSTPWTRTEDVEFIYLLLIFWGRALPERRAT